MQILGNIAYIKLANIWKKAVWSAGYKFVDKQCAKHTFHPGNSMNKDGQVQ